MTQAVASDHDYDDASVARLRAFVEQVTGGKVVQMERQVRWRPAWFVDVMCDSELIRLHLRGDRAGDVAIFPELKREADMMSILHDHGVPMPRIYGYCEDPPCIVMEALPGSRDVFEGTDEEGRRQVGRDYVAAAAKMHSLPLDPFVAAGAHRPEGAENIALVGLRAYLPHYERTKNRPEPLIEWALAWMKRNVPRHRSKASFVQFDCGQFLADGDRLTGLFDFEFSMIADPMVDLATMSMRDCFEPFGTPFPELCRHYEHVSGEEIDDVAVRFYNLLFATVSTMQFTAVVAEPQDGAPHAVYLGWDLGLRSTMLLALSELLGGTMPSPETFGAESNNAGSVIAALSDTIKTVGTAGPIDDELKMHALALLECVERTDRWGAEATARDLADISEHLGRRFESREDAEAALEAHVRTASADEDLPLFDLFARLHERRISVLEGTMLGFGARAVRLAPLR